MRATRRALAALAVVAIALYLGAAGYLFVFQRYFVFRPSGTISDSQAEAAGLGVVAIAAEDGTRLTGWYRPAEAGLPTLLYFHGNAGNIGGRLDRLAEVTGSGYAVLAMSYRGYGGAPGEPSEEAFFSDALAAFDWLAAETGAIVLYGESLGTGVATHAASRREALALVLEAPFTAIVDIASETYPWVPVGMLMRDQFRSRDVIASIDMPLLVVQGSEDETVPPAQGQRLFAMAREPKEIVVIDGAGHGDLWQRGLWDAVRGFLEAIPAGGTAPGSGG